MTLRRDILACDAGSGAIQDLVDDSAAGESTWREQRAGQG